ncbi:MAG TPA: hypothetical protein VJV05_15250 [Pyrinomonadaceae bacterium]|nr:hypothetical protein [Pyrinomonadaceae bacterium]
MKWKVELDEQGRFVRARQWDVFSLDDQADFMTAIFAGTHWKTGLGVLFDYRGLIIGDMSEGDLMAVRVIFQSARRRLESSRMALLCDSDELFELGRHFGEMLAEKIDTRWVIFRDETAAIAWLTEGQQSV